MAKEKVNQKINASKKLRIKFLVLMAISACSAGLILHLTEPNTTMYIPWICVAALNILTFLISGIGFLTNLISWIRASDEK